MFYNLLGYKKTTTFAWTLANLKCPFGIENWEKGIYDWQVKWRARKANGILAGYKKKYHDLQAKLKAAHSNTARITVLNKEIKVLQSVVKVTKSSSYSTTNILTVKNTKLIARL
jgi:hypothetical protein